MLRIFSVLVCAFMLGLPYFASLSMGSYRKVFDERLNLDSPWAVTAWILYIVWLLWPIVDAIRFKRKYPV